MVEARTSSRASISEITLAATTAGLGTRQRAARQEPPVHRRPRSGRNSGSSSAPGPVELTGPYPGEEAVPVGHGETQHRTGDVLGVTHDDGVRLRRDLDT